MREQTQSAIKLLEALTERAKELTCLYAIEELLNGLPESIERVCEGIIREIPAGWQFPDVCVATITLEGQTFSPAGFEETPWMLSGRILQQEREAGLIRVYYTEQMPPADIGPFLKEEDKLIQTIADRLSHFLTYSRMRRVFQEWQSSSRDRPNRDADWASVLDLLRQTYNALFVRIAGKMLNHLCWSGIEEAEALRRRPSPDASEGPLALGPSSQHMEEIFRVAGDHLSGDEILSRVQMWLQEDKLGTLAQTVLRHLPLAQVADALRRYCQTTHDAADERYPISRGLKVVLIRRILSGQLRYVNLLKDLVDIKDIYGLLQRVVFSSESHGKLGGKSAGLVLASQVLKKGSQEDDTLSAIRVPKTWHVPSDLMLHFMHYNSIDEIIEQKYKPIERVRLEYPHIIETFAHSPFPPEVARGLSMALDDFGERPLVVRSSSLLEDRIGGAFVGKYRSVFLANQGSKRQRLAALMRAVAEVYASVFGPDPIQYRAEHGLLEFGEEMGVMVQEVVGTRVGPYFLPAYSGLASSRSQFQWSPEARPEDGLIRLLPGLGTRAADRKGEGPPVLVVPGRAAADCGCDVEGRIRSAPWKIDVLNLETCRLETVELPGLLKKYGPAYPQVELVVSVRENDELRAVSKDELDFETQDLVVTFDGLLTRSPFVLQLRSLLRCLEERHGVPVEIEFVSDGEKIHLLQCRPQTQPRTLRPAPIPKDVPESAVLFSANRYVSNGWVGNITHVVYVDPTELESLDEPQRRLVGRAVSSLNELLPKRQ
ncbi:MAG: pyruvate, phosphate dikinase, partial [Deltaproteobacteria bacterium]|nr:pyruvate, phosphate dikinase [Deltaproteobacteria bacterium]